MEDHREQILALREFGNGNHRREEQLEHKRWKAKRSWKGSHTCVVEGTFGVWFSLKRTPPPPPIQKSRPGHSPPPGWSREL